MSTQAELKAQYRRWISRDYPGDADTQREMAQRKAAQARAKAHSLAVAHDSELTADELDAALVAWMQSRGCGERQIAHTLASTAKRRLYVAHMRDGAA